MMTFSRSMGATEDFVHTPAPAPARNCTAQTFQPKVQQGALCCFMLPLRIFIVFFFFRCIVLLYLLVNIIVSIPEVRVLGLLQAGRVTRL